MPRLRADVVAHRGASAYAPENTFAAFDLALSQGADVLELDVRPAADGHLVLVHDPTLERIAGDPRWRASAGARWRPWTNSSADAEVHDGGPQGRAVICRYVDATGVAVEGSRGEWPPLAA